MYLIIGMIWWCVLLCYSRMNPLQIMDMTNEIYEDEVGKWMINKIGEQRLMVISVMFNILLWPLSMVSWYVLLKRNKE